MGPTILILAATLINAVFFCEGTNYNLYHQRYNYYRYKCERLEAPENGNVKQTGVVLGSRALYSCDEGFVLSGDRKRICQRDGTFSGNAPTCEIVDCGPAELNIEDGIGLLEDGTTTVGSRVRYLCDPGFNLEGSEIIVCQADGTFSDDPPQCIPLDCGPPYPANANGELIFDETTLGSIALYNCDEGFLLQGAPAVTCTASGEWSAPAPICQPIDCGPLSNPSNGNVASFPGTTINSVATYTCQQGFRLIGDNTRACQSSGVWSGEQPSCQRIRCPSLRSPRYGKLSYTGYYPGDRVTYHCFHGYQGRRNHRVCLHSGVWSGQDVVCQKRSYYGTQYGYKSYDDRY